MQYDFICLEGRQGTWGGDSARGQHHLDETRLWGPGRPRLGEKSTGPWLLET